MPMALQSFHLHLSPFIRPSSSQPQRCKLATHTPWHFVAPSSYRAATLTGPSGSDVFTNLPPSLYRAEDDPASLPPGIRRDLMPNHVAVIMDGNRRWAQKRGFPTGWGHEAGARALRRVVELCCRWRIKVLTVFAFSSDNFFRPKVETDLLMGLFERVFRDELQHFVRENVRVSLIGDSVKLPNSLQVLLSDAEEATKNNSRLHLIVAINYSGQNDLVQACQKIARKVKDGVVEPEDVDKFLLESELGTNCTEFPNPDLLIRTSGELRISNFLLWQLAYTELYFTNSLWPDFGEDEFALALSSYQQRQRRYGGRSC